MANPSLQIGNSNWAIKEDDLLGYSTVGTNYLPKPMTMTRASAGTRVNPQGLVETVELLGDNLTTPLDFTTWVNSSATDITANSFTTSGSGRGVYFSLTTNKLYKINVSGVTGDISLRYRDGGGAGTVLGAFDTDLYFDTSGLTSPNIYLRALSATTATVTSVSVKEVTRDNLARVDYTDGTSSLLVEPMRTNLINYSEDLSQWTIVNGTLTPNATVSPDGTQNAGKVAFNNTGLDLKKTITVVAGQTYTISFYIKLESGTGLDGRFYDNNNSANIEVYDYTSQIQGTEWSKITRSVTAPIGCTQMQIWLLASSSSLVTASFWGAQFELGSYPTSYIPTDGGTVTRNQDIFTRDGIGSLINDSEGVLFAEIAAIANDTSGRWLSLSNGTVNERLSFGFQSSNIRLYIKNSSGLIWDYTTSGIDILNDNKIALKYKSGDYSLWINGTEVSTSTNSNLPSGLISLQFSAGVGGGSGNFFGKVKQLQIFKTALTDSELATLTT